MLSILLLILLSLCKAQWPLQNFGYDDHRPVYKPVDQSEYPYDGSSRLDNIPNPNLSQMSNAQDAMRPRTSYNPNLKLPESNDPKVKAMMEALEYSDSDSSEYDGDYILESGSVEAQPVFMDKEKVKYMMKDLDYTDSEDFDVFESSEDLEKDSLQDEPLLIKFPLSPFLSRVAGNVTLSSKTSVKDHVANLVKESSALRNDTDELVNQLHLLYLNLAIDESDNEVRMENSYKYGMSVVLRFLFEFYRIFRKLSSQTTETQLRLTNVDVYGLSYDKAVEVMKQKKGYSPLELSAPVRRSVYIMKSILYEIVTIIQTKCRMLDPNWICVMKFLANLLTESISCPNVWYHALIHMIALENIGFHDSFVYKVADFNKFKELTYFENIFDYIIEKIQEYKEVGRVQLSAEAVFFTMLEDLQESGLLDCISTDFLYN